MNVLARAVTEWRSDWLPNPADATDAPAAVLTVRSDSPLGKFCSLVLNEGSPFVYAPGSEKSSGLSSHRFIPKVHLEGRATFVGSGAPT
jgi:hypothetical protein